MSGREGLVTGRVYPEAGQICRTHILYSLKKGMLIAFFSENAFMKKTNIIATAAVATAGIAAYFIRRKFRAHKDQHNDQY